VTGAITVRLLQAAGLAGPIPVTDTYLLGNLLGGMLHGIGLARVGALGHVTFEIYWTRSAYWIQPAPTSAGVGGFVLASMRTVCFFTVRSAAGKYAWPSMRIVVTE